MNRKRRRRVRPVAAQLREELRVRDAVGCGVVHLEQDVEPVAVERTVGTLDDPHLPQRTAPIDRQAAERTAHFRQFSGAAGCPHPDPVHMPIDVEVGVEDPGGVVEVEGVVGQFLLKRRDTPHPYSQFVAKAVVVVSAGDRGGVQFQHGKDLDGLIVGLEVEETGVEAGEPLRTSHAPMLRVPGLGRQQCGLLG